MFFGMLGYSHKLKNKERVNTQKMAKVCITTCDGKYKILPGYLIKKNTLYLLYNCKLYGCPKCYNNKSYQNTLKLETELKLKGYKIYKCWECEL